MVKSSVPKNRVQRKHQRRKMSR